MSLRTAGYLGDKPFGTMWTNTVVLRAGHWDAYTLSYDLDICQGQSGSPVWVDLSRRPVVGRRYRCKRLAFYPVGPVALRA